DLVSGIRLRTVVCSRAEVPEVILPVQRTVISSGLFTVSRCNSGAGFAAITGPSFTGFGQEAYHSIYTVLESEARPPCRRKGVRSKLKCPVLVASEMSGC